MFKGFKVLVPKPFPHPPLHVKQVTARVEAQFKTQGCIGSREEVAPLKLVSPAGSLSHETADLSYKTWPQVHLWVLSTKSSWEMMDFTHEIEKCQDTYFPIRCTPTPSVGLGLKANQPVDLL